MNNWRSKPRKKRSVVWQVDRDTLVKIAAKSTSFAQIFKAFGCRCTGTGYKSLKERLAKESISFEHIALGLASNAGRRFQMPKIPLEHVLVRQSSYNRGHLKQRLLDEGLLKNQCYECGRGPMWNDKPLVLRLDHINGIHDDARLKNLRMLCPNCDSQMPTFSGRNKVRERQAVERSPSQGEYLAGASPATDANFRS